MSGHHHGSHSDSERRSDAWLLGTVALNTLLTVIQLIGGAFAGSVALVADALHNLNDAASLGIAIAARRIARRPADRQQTFGYRRAEVISALVQLTALIVTALFLGYEAIVRFFEERTVEGWIVIVVAGGALVIDVASAIIARVQGGGGSNMRAAFLHMTADALASVVVIIAGVLILLFDWYIADLIASLGLAIWIFFAALVEIRGPIHTLMQGAPADLDLDALHAGAATIEGIREIHHVHAWELDEKRRMLEAHVVIAEMNAKEMSRVKKRLRELLRDRFGIRHSTLELETEEEASEEGHDHGPIA